MRTKIDDATAAAGGCPCLLDLTATAIGFVISIGEATMSTKDASDTVSRQVGQLDAEITVDRHPTILAVLGVAEHQPATPKIDITPFETHHLTNPGARTE